MLIHVDVDDNQPCMVNVIKTNRPKQTDHRGRTWDKVGSLDDGTDIIADTTWGCYGYFYLDSQWYKFKFDDLK